LIKYICLIGIRDRWAVVDDVEHAVVIVVGIDAVSHAVIVKVGKRIIDESVAVVVEPVASFLLSREDARVVWLAIGAIVGAVAVDVRIARVAYVVAIEIRQIGVPTERAVVGRVGDPVCVVIRVTSVAQPVLIRVGLESLCHLGGCGLSVLVRVAVED